ncbi:MAG TPA: hypothetical protein VKG44_06960 [Candidatus Baltobacteraceae bacterium]|nr:hypothetical protein [Candidatus Baltobacteraceae bacterium]
MHVKGDQNRASLAVWFQALRRGPFVLDQEYFLELERHISASAPPLASRSYPC